MHVSAAPCDLQNRAYLLPWYSAFHHSAPVYFSSRISSQFIHRIIPVFNSQIELLILLLHLLYPKAFSGWQLHPSSAQAKDFGVILTPLFLTPHLVHQQIMLGLLLKYIPNMIISCSLLSQYPGPSHYPHCPDYCNSSNWSLGSTLALAAIPSCPLTNLLSTQQLVSFLKMLVRSYTTLLKTFLIYHCVPSHSTPTILVSLVFLEPFRYILSQGHCNVYSFFKHFSSRYSHS